MSEWNDAIEAAAVYHDEWAAHHARFQNVGNLVGFDKWHLKERQFHEASAHHIRLMKRKSE